MAATYAEFVLEFPEFQASDPNLVSAKLAAAALEVDVSACGTLRDQITYYKAAQKLAKMPTGNTSKLVNKDGSTVYDGELTRLSHIAVGAGPRAV